MSTPHLLPVRYYTRLCDVVERLGYDSTPLLQAADVARKDMQNPDGLITLGQMEALVTTASKVTGRSALGLELAHALRLTSHSMVSYGILSSPTLGYCLGLVARYFSLILPSFRMGYTCDSRSMRTSVQPVWPLSRLALAFHLETIVACIHRETRELLDGDSPTCRAYFSIARPPHANRYDGYANLHAKFGWQARPGVRMEWSAEVAARPLAMAEPRALKLAEQRCDAMINRARSAGKVANWVRMMLREGNGEPPSRRELANALNLSARTLDRSLQREGTSFRALSNGARVESACDLLRAGQLSVTQIAYELGYSDASNFTRAFKRQTGCSPTVWRGNGPVPPTSRAGHTATLLRTAAQVGLKSTQRS